MASTRSDSPSEHIRVLPRGERFRLGAAAVAAAVAEDRRAARPPALVGATVGTTNCGAADELDALAEVCAAEALWLHVDGAYGAPVCPLLASLIEVC